LVIQIVNIFMILMFGKAFFSLDNFQLTVHYLSYCKLLSKKIIIWNYLNIVSLKAALDIFQINPS